jgi:hypothetical protein
MITANHRFYPRESSSDPGVGIGSAVGFLGAVLVALFLVRRCAKSATASRSAGNQPPVATASSTKTNDIGDPPATASPTKTNDIGDPPYPDHSVPLALPEGAKSAAAVYGLPPAAGRTAPASKQPKSPPPVVTKQAKPPTPALTTRIERPPSTHHGGLVSQFPTSPSSSGSVDPKELYSSALRGSVYSVKAPNDTSSTPWASGIV